MPAKSFACPPQVAQPQLVASRSLTGLLLLPPGRASLKAGSQLSATCRTSSPEECLAQRPSKHLRKKNHPSLQMKT